MDFVHYQLASGKKIRILTVVDIFSKFSPLIDPQFSYRGEDVVQTPERACAETSYPGTIRVDQGSEFVSRDLDLWAYTNGVTLDFSRPGKPTDNAFIEAFNSKLRAECLNTHWFMSLEDAREKLEDWRRYYDEDRPHSGFGLAHPARDRFSRLEILASDEVVVGIGALKPKNSSIRCVSVWEQSNQKKNRVMNGGNTGASRFEIVNEGPNTEGAIRKLLGANVERSNNYLARRIHKP